MIKPRIIWAFCFMGALLFFLFWESWVSLAALVVVIVVPLVLLVVNQLTANKLALSFAVPSLGEKNRELNGALLVSNQSLIPHAPLTCKLRCENLLTGEILCPQVMFPSGAKSNQEVAFSLESKFCGNIKVSLEQPKVYDPFGLWGNKLSEDPKGSICVLPQTFAPHLVVLQNMSKDIDADEYSQEKPGADPSETFAIRDYLPGDSLRRIHWKLSWKYDNLIVREPGLPVEHSFLVLLETSLSSDSAKQEPQVLDTIIEITVSLCQTMLEEEITFDIAWYDHDEQALVSRHINDTDDLSGLLGKLMSARSMPNDLNATERYSEKYGEASFEHVIYISPYLTEGIYSFAGEGRATAIICQSTAEVSLVDDGNMMTYYCSPETYVRELAYLEI